MPEVPAEVDVLDDEDASWPHRLVHATEERDRIGEMREQEPGINEVLLLVVAPALRIGMTKLHVAQRETRGVGSRHIELRFVDVEADDMAFRGNELRELQ